jgi:hypothetical protein
MIPHHVYYQLVILALIWLCLMLPHLWPSLPRESPKRPAAPIKRKRSTEPKVFAGLTQKPLAQFLAVCSSSILAETLGCAALFSSSWRGKRRV